MVVHPNFTINFLKWWSSWPTDYYGKNRTRYKYCRYITKQITALVFMKLVTEWFIQTHLTDFAISFTALHSF